MDTTDISTRLHDILRTACRVRQTGLGCTAEARVESIDQVKAGLRTLIADLGEQPAPRLPPRVQASAAAFPEGRIAGTRATVQHRRRIRSVGTAATSRPKNPRDATEALFGRSGTARDRDEGAAIRR